MHTHKLDVQRPYYSVPLVGAAGSGRKFQVTDSMEGVKCSKCFFTVSKGSFCSQCGTPLVDGAVRKEIPAWKSKYVDEFYRGAVISKNEHWSFENGEVVLVKGKGHCKYAWLGDLFEVKESTTDNGVGRWNGELISWHFQDMNTPFYTYTIGADEKSVSCNSIAFGNTKWNFAFDGNDFKTDSGQPTLEGTDDRFFFFFGFCFLLTKCESPVFKSQATSRSL